MTTYTQEQYDIAIIKCKQDDTAKMLDRIDARLSSIEGNMKSQYHNFTNYILGIYGLILASALSRVWGFL